MNKYFLFLLASSLVIMAGCNTNDFQSNNATLDLTFKNFSLNGSYDYNDVSRIVNNISKIKTLNYSVTLRNSTLSVEEVSNKEEKVQKSTNNDNSHSEVEEDIDLDVDNSTSLENETDFNLTDEEDIDLDVGNSTNLNQSSDQIIYFQENFTTSTKGNYLLEEFMQQWNYPDWHIGIEEETMTIVNNSFLRIDFPSGWDLRGRGAAWPTVLESTSDEVYISYKVKFSEDFDFVRGGKLPGLAGGEGNTGGRKPNGEDGWSARIMWGPTGEIVQYVYHPDQPRMTGDVMYWNLHGQVYIERGTWHEIQTRVKLNTPGSTNGTIQSWFDGELVFERNDLRFRDIEEIYVDLIAFSVFFGGADSSWAPTKNESIYFDDFLVSSKSIIG